MSHGFLRNTTIVGLLTLLSRVTGVIRDMVYLISFGAGPLMDAFLVAFKIPNFMRRLTAEGAFSQAFVPVISEYKVRKSHAEVRELVAGVSGKFGIVLFAVALAGVVAAPVLTFLFAPGWHGGDSRFDLTVDMLRFTFPYMFFISLVALGSGILNSYGRFAVPALTQTLLNLVMIVTAAFVAPYFARPGIVLAIGVFVAGLVQLVAQFPALHAIGLLPRPRLDRAREGVARIARLMLPGIFGSSVAQVSLLLDTIIASFLVVGSVTWLYSADRLVEFPMGVFSIALATVILPGLSSHHSAKSPEKFNATLDWALRLTVAIVVPASLGLLMLSGPLIATIFGYGAFTDRDVLMCGYALMAYSFGLLGFSLVKVLAPGYFARQDTKTPVKVGVISLSFNMAFNLVVVVPAFLMDFPAPHVLLAASTALSAAINSTLLYRGLRRDGIYFPSPAWRKLLPQVVVAGLAMSAFLWWVSGDWAAWTGWSAARRAGWLGLAVGGGTLVYFGALALAGLRPRDLKHL
ncbi:MAG TPA: murein biosynthesis integral membrane protein MurJ [Steroidobacteraceae bacterium]|nr:murein biosynthesis integral membrane protein MurJ [Steroidobacteraceae bacterium]